MMEEELSQLLKEHGWSLYKRTRGKQIYLYALKWKKGQIYISSQNNLPKITRETVLQKIEAA